MNIRVKTVLKAKPPITVMANGAPILPIYSASPIASGINAIIVVMAVINIGLTRAIPEIMSARLLLYPCGPLQHRDGLGGRAGARCLQALDRNLC